MGFVFYTDREGAIVKKPGIHLPVCYCSQPALVSEGNPRRAQGQCWDGQLGRAAVTQLGQAKATQVASEQWKFSIEVMNVGGVGRR